MNENEDRSKPVSINDIVAAKDQPKRRVTFGFPIAVGKTGLSLRSKGGITYDRDDTEDVPNGATVGAKNVPR